MCVCVQMNDEVGKKMFQRAGELNCPVGFMCFKVTDIMGGVGGGRGVIVYFGRHTIFLLSQAPILASINFSLCARRDDDVIITGP